MAGYKWDRFGGERPLATRLRLRPNEAVRADNIDLHRGVVTPRATQHRWLQDVDPLLTLANEDDVPTSIFRFRDRVTTLQYWMYWTTDVDVAPGPVENDEQRHYYTGAGSPKMFTKESINNAEPPYPQPPDTKFPKTWFYLGVPAPAAAPTIDGDSYVPPDTAKSGVITGVHAPHMIIRFNPSRGHRGTDILRSEGNGVSTDVSGDTHMDSDGGAMVMRVLEVGVRVKVTEIIDADQVRCVGTVGTGCFESFGSNYDDQIPENRLDERWTWDEDEIATLPFEDISFTKKVYRKINGKRNDICWSYHVPDGAVLQVASHSLKVGDVLRIISPTTPMTWSTPTRVRVGPPLVAGVRDRQRPFYNTADATIEFEGELTYFIERDGREFDPTIEDVVVDSREPTTRSYVYTYVTSLGEEGPPSAPTDPFTLALGDSVMVKGFTAPPTAHRDITKYFLYRTNTGTQGTAFQLVDEIVIADYDEEEGYLDEKTDDELGEVLQSETWEPPPADMIGICAMPNQFLAGFYENVLCFSEPGFPHAWPVEYRLHLEHKIMGIKPIGGVLIVATRGTPYVVAGTHPRQMAARREEQPAPCVDKRSMVDCGDAVIYVSTDGLIAATPSGFRNVTREHYTREQWLERVVGASQLNPRARGYYFDGEYLLFTSTQIGTGNSLPNFSNIQMIAGELLPDNKGYSDGVVNSTDPYGAVFGDVHLRSADAVAVSDFRFAPGEIFGQLVFAVEGSHAVNQIARVTVFDVNTLVGPDLGGDLVLDVADAIAFTDHGTHTAWRWSVNPDNLDLFTVDEEYQITIDAILPGDSASDVLFAAYAMRVFDFRDPQVLRITSPGIVEPRGAFTDPTDGELYYVPGVDDLPGITFLFGELDPGTAPILRWRSRHSGADADGLSAGVYESGVLFFPRPMALSVARVLCRRAREAGFVSVAQARLVVTAWRYDGVNLPEQSDPLQPDQDVEEAQTLTLVDATVMEGNSNDSEWPGEQGSKPFRVEKNLLVDAVSIRLEVSGLAEIEAVYVAESFDDLLMLERA